jgi:hypothetical protein
MVDKSSNKDIKRFLQQFEVSLNEIMEKTREDERVFITYELNTYNEDGEIMVIMPHVLIKNRIKSFKYRCICNSFLYDQGSPFNKQHDMEITNEMLHSGYFRKQVK